MFYENDFCVLYSGGIAVLIISRNKFVFRNIFEVTGFAWRHKTWPRSIFIIGRVWWWNWYSAHINLNNGILWGIIPICRIFAKKWHILFCSGGSYNFWPFALTRECALHFRPCKGGAKPISHAVLPVSPKRNGESLNKFYIMRNKK